MSKHFDTIVIGLGAFGSATTYQLAKRGRAVLGIDRYAPPHTLGSTHGDTRITRLACGEGPMYTATARRSHEIWRDLERQTGKPLLVQNGMLLISGAGRRAAAHGKDDFLGSTIDVARRNGVVHETLSEADIRHRFPAFNIGDGDRGYFEPEAGFVFPEECVATQLMLAGATGAQIRTGETVQRIEPRGGKVEVTTDRDLYTAANAVLSAGPWLPQLLPQRQSLFTIRRQVLTWFAIDDAVMPPAQYRPDKFPVFYWQVPRRRAIYGFPWIGDGEPVVKLAAEQYDFETTPDTVERNVSAQEIQDMYRDYIAGFFPGVSDHCVKSTVCLYTCADDARFIVDRLPGQPQVIVASPCSGHGFKHSAAIGEALAEMACGHEPTEVSLDAFRFETQAA
jgi:sarcosine oxidase